MTTFLHFLGDLTALDWAFIGIAWLIIAFALGTFTGLGISLADKRKSKPAYVDVTLSLPPVPESDADWLKPWPTEVNEEAVIAAEFVSLINSNFHWPWPDTEDAQ